MGSDVYWEGDDEIYEMISVAHNHEVNKAGKVSPDDPTFEPSVEVPVIDQSYTIGTKVYFKFEDDRWVSGKITGYNQGKLSYTVTIRAGDMYGSVDLYQEFQEGDKELDLMVKQAENCRRNIKNYCGTQTYSVGSFTYGFSENGWRSGRITEYQSGDYTVAWDDKEGNVYVYRQGSGELKQMVKLASECRQSKNNYCGTQAYPVGTLVYYNFDDGWFHGEITGYDRGLYRVTWQDGSTDSFEEGKNMSDLDEMVAQAQALQKNNSGLNSAGKAAISIGVIGLVSCAAFFFIRKRRTRIVLEQPEYEQREANLQKSRAALMA